ncbi:MAG: hypothetical protein M3Y87_19565 [Myxococcota bacterium]|nr:hypothetical protein [Myxococcota bacterium]
MDSLRNLQWTAASASDAPDASTERATGDREVAPGPVAIDPALLSRAAHDLRSPLTVLVCNRRFLEEILTRAGIDSAEVREILEDDAAALARLEEAAASLDSLARRSR